MRSYTVRTRDDGVRSTNEALVCALSGIVATHAFSSIMYRCSVEMEDATVGTLGLSRYVCLERDSDDTA